MKQHFSQLSWRHWLMVAIAVVSYISPVTADDWHFVRRDVGSNGAATSPLPRELAVRWTYQAGENAGFEATPVVDNEIIYVGDNVGTFHAVLLDDGRGIWKQPLPDTAFLGGAVWDDGTLYAGDANGMVSALSIEDGHELWNTEVPGEVYAGPTVENDSLFITCEAGVLTCLNKSTGSKSWQFKIDAPLRCTPTIAAGRILLAGCDSKLRLVDTASGKETDSVAIDAPTGATAAYVNGRAYFGTEGGTFYAIDLPADGKTPRVAWTYRDPERGQPIRSAAAVNDKLVVYGSQGKAIYALDPASGTLKWKLATRSRVDSSPVIAGDQVVAATERGVIYLLDAATGAIHWQYDAGGGFAGSPAVIDGNVVIGNSDGSLYCFGAAAAQTAVSPSNGAAGQSAE